MEMTLDQLEQNIYEANNAHKAALSADDGTPVGLARMEEAGRRLDEALREKRQYVRTQYPMKPDATRNDSFRRGDWPKVRGVRR